MSEDRTSPMGVPGKPRREAGPGGQETIAGGQDAGMAPTIAAPGQTPGPGFVRATPQETPTPQPQQRPAMPFGPLGQGGHFPPPGGAPQGPAPAGDQTMVISQRLPPVFAWLVVVDGPDQATIGKVHSLRPDMTTVGRAQGNTVVLADQTCSSQHFRIRVEPQGEGEEPVFMLYDMGSRNGTFVGTKANYRETDSQSYRRALEDGDYLLVGETTLVFKKI